MDTQELVLRYLLYTCIRRKEAQDQPRIVWIQNTACLRRIYISEALAHEARQLKDFRVTCESRRWKQQRWRITFSGVMSNENPESGTGRFAWL